MFYNSYILPQIDYGINMWGNSAACYIKRIQILQNKAARIILNADWYTSSHVLLTQLKWMSISQRKNYHICLLMYKLFNGLTPSACNVFEFNDDSYNFRDTTSIVLKVPHPNTELFKKGFRYSGSVLWNSLPADVHDACNFNNFKFMLKRYLMQS